jgi:hypothetical protein
VILRSLFAALILLAPLAARADGAGIALSDDARLHLFFESELRYDSLAGQGIIGSSSAAANTVVDPADFILHLKPGLKIVESGTQVSLTGSAFLDYADYTGWLAPTHDLSYLGAGIGAQLAVGKTGPVGLTVNEGFTRSDHTTNPALGIGTITDANDLGARVAFRPGGGAIEAGLGYNFGIENYELRANGVVGCGNDPNCTGADFSNFNSQTHRFSLDGRWKFFPKTALVADAQFALRRYANAGLDTNGKPFNIDADPFQAELGLAGLITEKIRVVIKGGYANTFTSSGDNFSGPVAQLEAGWDPTETATATAGLIRTVQPVSSTFAYYGDYRGYLSGKIAVGRVNFSATGSLDLISFGGPSGRQDTQAALDAVADVEVFKLFHTALGVTLTSRASSSQAAVFSYQRAELYLRLNFTY